MQAVDHLIGSGCDVDVNVKNLEGKTARDIFHEQTQVDKQIEPLLRRAGAKKASSLKVTPSADYYLRRKVSLPEKLRIRRSRQKWSLSDDKRNGLLVVATLLITVTYQGILSPPENSSWKFSFIILNSATFMLSHTIIFQLIPSGYFYVVLQAALFFLYGCYVFSCTAIGVTYFPFFILVFVSTLLYNIVVGMEFFPLEKKMA